MRATSRERRDFIPYPTNRVVGTIADAKNARAAIDALLQAGIHQEDIDILYGEADVHRLDPTGEEHGFLAKCQRTLIRTAGPGAVRPVADWKDQAARVADDVVDDEGAFRTANYQSGHVS